MAGTPIRRARNGSPAPGATGHTETHPPFEPGNTAAETHGATSPRRIAPLAMRRAEQLPIEAPWTARQPFRGARESLAWCEAQLELLRAYGDAQGMLDAKGQTRPAVDLMHRLEGRVSTLRGELGLTPQALAKLLGQLAGVAAAGGDEEALTALKTEGARILAARAVGPSGDGADAA